MPKHTRQFLVMLFCFCAMPCIAHAFQFHKYTQHIHLIESDAGSRDTLLSIVNACGHAYNLDDDCVLQELDRVAAEENNRYAQSILSDYEMALQEGNAQNLECQTESHMQVNRTLGHCVLLLHFNALADRNMKEATHKYEICLQGGMLGLAYQGNLAAQYLLAQLFAEKEMLDNAKIWRKSLKRHKDAEGYLLMVQCYR